MSQIRFPIALDVVDGPGAERFETALRGLKRGGRLAFEKQAFDGLAVFLSEVNEALVPHLFKTRLSLGATVQDDQIFSIEHEGVRLR